MRRHVLGALGGCGSRVAGLLLIPVFVITLANAGEAASAGAKDIQAVAKSYRAFGEQQQTMEGLQAELNSMAARRRALQSQQAYIEAKIAWAKRKLAGRGAADKESDDVDKWMREVKAWESALADHQEGLAKAAEEEEALMKALGEVARSRTENDMLVPGELVEVFVAEDETLNGLYQIRAGGYVVMPRMPKLFVAGKTVVEAEKAITEALGENQLRNATVTVDRVQPEPEAQIIGKEILYLTGQVKKPGPWPIPTDFSPTIVTTLLRNGTTTYADLTRVHVLRLVEGRGLMETINVRAILDGEGLTPDFALEPNDIIMVPAKETGERERNAYEERHGRRVFVQGYVVEPGTVHLQPPARVTALAAIRHCGGPARMADLSKLELIRIERETTRREILDLGAIMNGTAPDVNLLAEDILVLYGKDKRIVLTPMRVYLTGNVKKEGPVEIKGEEGKLTLLQALLHNGGFARFADLRDVAVLRDMGNGIRNRIPVDIKKVKRGIIPDLVLEDNDIVVVPEKFFSF